MIVCDDDEGCESSTYIQRLNQDKTKQKQGETTDSKPKHKQAIYFRDEEEGKLMRWRWSNGKLGKGDEYIET